LDSAKIFRVIMQWIRQQLKAAPLQTLGEADPAVSGVLSVARAIFFYAERAFHA
jgi:hypothetical protein